MIPKIIHYCWFGHNPKPELTEKCINSWKKYCPDYEIIEWNEDNYDITGDPLYVRQAYETKKWAFVSDYARLNIVHQHGGIYLDTDVELIGNLDGFLENTAFFASDGRFVSTGLGFGAEKEAAILGELMNAYTEIPFIRPDGGFDEVPCPIRNTDVFLGHGLMQNNKEQILDGSHIYPSEVFCPIDQETGTLTRTKKTVSIHWFDGSWIDSARKKQWEEVKHLGRIIGIERAWVIVSIIDGCKREGLISYVRGHVFRRKKN